MSVSSSSKTTNLVEANPRGIPKAVFLVRPSSLPLASRTLNDLTYRGSPPTQDDVEVYIGGAEADAELPLKALQETLSKYRFMEQNSLQRRAAVEEKIPELERSVEMVETLMRKKEQGEPFETTFELSDTLYTRGEIEDVDEVYIWLGANTMLSYPLPSAHSLLSSKLLSATTSKKNLQEDLIWLRDQITVTEVNVARVYNWDVKRRRERRERGEKEDGTGGEEGK